MNEFATRLNSLMAEKGLRQVDIVTRTGINKGRVSRWMNGGRKTKENRIGKPKTAYLCGFQNGHKK